jgi:parallel beta-helix repeat protein
VLDGNSQFLWTATAGNHSIAFLLDVDGHVDEDNESDNSTSVTVSTQPCIVPADDTIVVSDAVVCPGTYNVVDANEDGILRTFASGVTVNFAGATLAGSGTGYGVVAQNVSGVTLLGGSSGAIRGFRSAVLLTDGANHLVEGLDLSNNRKRPLQHTVADFLAVWPDWDEQVTRDQIGNGVVLLRVTDSTIRGNVMRNQQNGIGLFESHRVLIENNNCSDNQGWGLHLHRSSDNTVRDNVADNNHLAASTYCHDVQQDGCDTAAILVIKDSNDNLVEGNSLRNSGDGVFSGAQESAVHWGADRNRYVDNDVSLAKHIGIESTFSDANELLGNLIQGCGRYGVWLGYSKNATIADNTITGNAIAGIANESAQSIEVRDNAIDGNGTGVLLWRGSFPFVDQDSQDYVFTGNSVSENSGLGLSLVDTHRVTVADNTIADNAAGNLFLGSELESEIQGPIAVHQNNILGLSLPYNVSSDCCDFDCGVCDGQVDCCNSLPGCAYYLCSNQCHPEGTSNCDAGCSEFCSASAAPFASPGIGPSPGGGLPELAVSTPAPYTPAGPAAKATEAECRVCDGDVGCCDATEGCAYYFCSRQCHPVGTSNCAAGCTAQCDCRANDGDVNACNAAEGCAYYLCSDQCHPEGTSNCDAGCPEFCGPGACRVNDGDVNACNATAGCAYYLCSDQCHPVGTSNCDAGCPEFCAPDPCRANDGDVNACNATMGCAYYNCSDQCHPVGTSNCDAGCTEFCTGDGFCGWDEIVDLSENWWGTNDFGVIGSKICGDIPFLPILFGPAF